MLPNRFQAINAQYQQYQKERNVIQTYKRPLDGLRVNCTDYGTLTRPNYGERVQILQAMIQSSKYQFYNYEQAMNVIACTLENTFNQPDLATKVRLNIVELQQIGERSAFGKVWNAKFFNNLSDFVLLKTAQNEDFNPSLYHEYFVATMCLNFLRQWVPNFMYVYGTFQCTSPVGPVNFCKKGFDTYLMIEYIQGPSFRNFIQERQNLEEIIVIIVQLVIALDRVYNACGFTHYDLHAGNVLLRQIRYLTGTNDVYVGMQFLGGSKFYIKADMIPTLIDYGKSRVEVEGQSYGYFLDQVQPDSSVNPYRGRPLHDLFKLVGWTIYNAYEAGNRALMTSLMPMLRFFEYYKTLNDDQMVAQIENDVKNVFEISNRYPELDNEMSNKTVYKRFYNYLIDVDEYYAFLGYRIFTQRPVGPNVFLLYPQN